MSSTQLAAKSSNFKELNVGYINEVNHSNIFDTNKNPHLHKNDLQDMSDVACVKNVHQFG